MPVQRSSAPRALRYALQAVLSLLCIPVTAALAPPALAQDERSNDHVLADLLVPDAGYFD
jgi:hypothetical protein